MPRCSNGVREGETNPFDEDQDEDWDDGGAILDNGEPGIMVRALYDYEAAEQDELTFKAGRGTKYHFKGILCAFS